MAVTESRPHIVWRAPEEVHLEAVRPSLVTTFGGGVVRAGCEIAPDGRYQLTWSVDIRSTRTLPEVELFIAKVATYIIDEPLEEVDGGD